MKKPWSIIDSTSFESVVWCAGKIHGVFSPEGLSSIFLVQAIILEILEYAGIGFIISIMKKLQRWKWIKLIHIQHRAYVSGYSSSLMAHTFNFIWWVAADPGFPRRVAPTPVGVGVGVGDGMDPPTYYFSHFPPKLHGIGKNGNILKFN